MGLPTLRDSSTASSSDAARNRSASRSSTRARSAAVARRHSPCSKDRRAAATAAPTSSTPASATRASTSPVAGSTTAPQRPDRAGTRSPPIQSPPSPLSTMTGEAYQRASSPLRRERTRGPSGAELAAEALGHRSLDALAHGGDLGAAEGRVLALEGELEGERLGAGGQGLAAIEVEQLEGREQRRARPADRRRQVVRGDVLGHHEGQVLHHRRIAAERRHHFPLPRGPDQRLDRQLRHADPPA